MLNVITLVGRLTRDPQTRVSNSGTQIATFTIANDDGAKNDNSETLFIDCVLFGKQSETLIRFFHKGNLIGVTGRLNQRSFLNKENVKTTRMEINVTRIEFIESNRVKQEEPEAPAEVKTSNTENIELSDDDLPF